MLQGLGVLQEGAVRRVLRPDGSPFLYDELPVGRALRTGVAQIGVELRVEAEAWHVREVTLEEAEASWDEHRPDPVDLPPLDLTVTDLVDIEDVTPEPEDSGAAVLAVPNERAKAQGEVDPAEKGSKLDLFEAA